MNKNLEFDTEPTQYGDDKYYKFNFRDYISQCKDNYNLSLVEDNVCSRANGKLLDAIYAYSSISDSNAESRKLVEKYRQSLKIQ